MISDIDVRKARKQFETAAKEFGFVFHSPFPLTDTVSAFGYIEHYGSRNGVVICLAAPPEFERDSSVITWCIQHDFFYSILNIQPLLGEYRASYFREMLRDWGHD